ncbi:glycosyltransferase [Solibacillus silvestris]|uniref:glycosyltransferase n=1 Tax=Solibacillus silvestris TaxID=76853 RepID=UPI003F816FC1
MKKARGIYLLFSDEKALINAFPGVHKKVINQLKSFAASEMSVDLVYYNFNNPVFTKVLNMLPLELYVTNFKREEFENIDFIYIRKPDINSSFIRLLTKIKRKTSCKILMEIPTYPYDSEYKDTIISEIKLKKEMKYRQKLCGLIDKIVTFSNDKMIWGIETIKVSNGIDLESLQTIKSNNIKYINMIAAATHNFWHGYDRLIRGMADFKKKFPLEIDRVKLHIVGDGPAISEYKKIVVAEKLEGNVFFYGNLIGKSLDEVFSISNLGVDALARHRSEVYYNSSLKGKEYCARGLPIISGVETELDGFAEFPYYFRVPADDSNIEIKDIITFFNSVYEDEQEEVIRNIRKFAEDRFDMGYTMKPIIEYLNDI